MSKKIKITFLNWWVENGNDIPNANNRTKHNFFKRFIENYLGFETIIVKNNPDILFFSVPTRKCPIEFVKENANIKLKIFFCGENTKNPRWKRYDYHYLNFADIALGFPDIIHNNYIRFPYWLTQINLENLNMGMVNLPFCKLDNFKINTNRDFCCIINSHDMYNTRINIIKYLNEYKLVHVSGNIHNNFDRLNIPYIKLSCGKNIDNKILTLNKFTFNICSENSFTPNYVTEKIFECIIGGCIPIYYGEKDLLIEPEILNNDFIIKYNNNNINEVVTKIKELDSNPEILKKFLEIKPLKDDAYNNIIKKYDQLKYKILEYI